MCGSSQWLQNSRRASSACGREGVERPPCLFAVVGVAAPPRGATWIFRQGRVAAPPRTAAWIFRGWVDGDAARSPADGRRGCSAAIPPPTRRDDICAAPPRPLHPAPRRPLRGAAATSPPPTRLRLSRPSRLVSGQRARRRAAAPPRRRDERPTSTARVFSPDDPRISERRSPFSFVFAASDSWRRPLERPSKDRTNGNSFERPRGRRASLPFGAGRTCFADSAPWTRMTRSAGGASGDTSAGSSATTSAAARRLPIDFETPRTGGRGIARGAGRVHRGATGSSARAPREAFFVFSYPTDLYRPVARRISLRSQSFPSTDVPAGRQPLPGLPDARRSH